MKKFAFDHRRSWSRAFAVLLAIFIAGPFAQGQSSLPQNDAAEADTKGALNFIAVGDWGRYGEPSQRAVAEQMARTAQTTNAKFFISTGDNFYPSGVASVDDPQWQESYEQVYKEYALHQDWFVVLGNHDYHGNPQAEIDYTQRSQRWHMPARYYSVTKNVDSKTQAQFFFIDTSPFIDEYRKEPDNYAIAGQDTKTQLTWLETELAKSKAKWKFVVGHHHIYSGGKRHTQSELEKAIVPLMAKYGVQIYLCGHEHDLQVIHRPGGNVTYLVSGTGSEHRPTGNTEGTLFSASAYGFMALSLSSAQLGVQIVDDSGKKLYATTIRP